MSWKYSNVTDEDINKLIRTIKYYEFRYELSAGDFGRLIGCTRQSICNWLSGRCKIPIPAYIALSECIKYIGETYEVVNYIDKED